MRIRKNLSGFFIIFLAVLFLSFVPASTFGDEYADGGGPEGVSEASSVSGGAENDPETDGFALPGGEEPPETGEARTEGGAPGTGELLTESPEDEKEPETAAVYELLRAEVSGEVLSYTGSERTKESVTVYGSVTENGETREAELAEGTDYVIEYKDNINAGTAVLLITGIGNYAEKRLEETFEIAAAELSGMEIEPETFVYTGSPIEPEAKVYALINKESILLDGGSDYRVSYRDNLRIGTAVMTVTGQGNYTGTLTGTFAIKGTLKDAKLKYGSLTYTGKERKQSGSVTVTGDGNGETVVLTYGTDYTITYADNINAGTAVMTIIGTGDYTGSLERTFFITPAKITSARIQYAVMTYNGKERTQTDSTVVKCGKKILNNEEDYTISYTDNLRIGTATMTVTGTGNYAGILTRTFAIKGKLRAAELKYASMPYNGKSRRQGRSAIVKGNHNGKIIVLKYGEDYGISYENNKNVGTATMKITGKGQYTGTLTKTFDITAAALKDAVLPCSAKLYTGKALKPKPTVTAEVDGETITLTRGTDYTVSWKNNKDLGDAAVTVAGIGNYEGTLERTFVITRMKVSRKGRKRTITYSSADKKYRLLRAAVWSESDGQDDIVWYEMSRNSGGNWTTQADLANLKDSGTINIHIYAGSKCIYRSDRSISHAEWLKAQSERFRAEFLKGTNSYANIDYIQCAVSIANNNYYGYDHTWRQNRHTMSCAGLVDLCLTHCGYGDFIKDDPAELIDGRRWGYLDLGTYSGKYNWRSIMLGEVGATWHAGLDGIEPGDVLYYDYSLTVNHTGFYLGNGVTLEARGPATNMSFNDDSGAEIAAFGNGLAVFPWQGYFRIPNRKKAW